MGGGSAGLGLAVARALLAEGARVVLNGRDAARLDAARTELGADARRLITVAGDVAAPGEAARVVAEAAAWGGRLDILLANAGGPPAGPIGTFDDAAWEAAVRLSLLAHVRLCQAAVPHMRAHAWGRIVVVASVAARQPVAGLALSTTARAGLLGYAKALSDEVAADGITVNVLCPGYILTDRLRQLAAAVAEREGTSEGLVLERFGRSAPMGRVGTPDELAAAALFLMSEGASFITGVALAVDGGATRAVG